MLNFFALEPREFAELSRDILQKIVKKELYLTDGPYDEGIDFTDDLARPHIIGQAKRYFCTPVNQLMRELSEESERVKSLRPEAYYLFLSRDLTGQRLKQIVHLFQPYTEFTHQHIFTLGRMDDLLQTTEYRDILDKHPKLWNFSMDTLSRALYRNVDFDTREMLLSIQAANEFVPTEGYCTCLELLEQDHGVLLQGAPGTGKTMVSRRIALEFAHRGYRVHFTTDGNLQDVKGILSWDDTPELILLDDFLGQMYLTLDPGRANELETLLHFVQRSEHKRILLNSRITVLQEAERSIPLFSRILSHIQKVNVDDLSKFDKAHIFQSNLKKYCADRPHIFHYIASEERYQKIIEHPNFNPRIIGMMAATLGDLSDPEEFYSRLLEQLGQPANIWAQEFEQNLRPEDRVLLTTLYSLTNTDVDFSVLKTCYNARITAMPEIDKTVDQMGNALKRLNRSMIRQTWDETRKISVLNPSVNDFLSQYLQHHPLEQQAIVASSVYFEQAYKVLHNNPWKDILSTPALFDLVQQKWEDRSLLDWHFQDQAYLGNILAYLCIVRQPLQDDVYRDRLLQLLQKGAIDSYQPFLLGSPLSYLQPLFSEPLFSYYQMERQLSHSSFVEGLMKISHSPEVLLPVLSQIWAVISSPAAKYEYDLAGFQQKATEYAQYSLLDKVDDMDTFYMERYDQSKFEYLVQDIPRDMPVEDVLDYFEFELSTFIEDDLTEQYVEYVRESILEALYEQPWFEGTIDLDQDTILIDQNIWKNAEVMLDNAMYDYLPEDVYEAYTSQRRESINNMHFERRILELQSHPEAEQQEEKIRSLFEDQLTPSDSDS